MQVSWILLLLLNPINKSGGCEREMQHLKRLLYRYRDPFRDGSELDVHPSFLLIVSLPDDGAA
jgi:hypothetical protein